MAIIEKNIRMNKKNGSDTIVSYPQTVDTNILVDGKTMKLSDKLTEIKTALNNNKTLTNDELMLIRGFDNLQNWKGFTSTFSETATSMTTEIKKGAILRAKRIVDTSVAGTIKTTETFYQSDGATVLQQVIFTFNESTTGGVTE